MFVRTPVFFDTPDDSGGAPDAGTDTSADALAAARSEFLNNPPEIPDTPDEPAAEIDPLDEAAADLDATPPAGDAPAVPATGGTPDDPYAEFGGREAVERALSVDAALRTESGLRLIIAQGLQALNYTPQQIRAALEGGPSLPLPAGEAEPEVAPLVDVEDDDYVSGADLKRIVARVAEDAATKAAAAVRGEVTPVAEAFAQQQQRQASEAADATYVELLGAFPEDAAEQEAWRAQQNRLQQAGGAFIDPDDWSPASVRMALLRANEAVKAEDEANLRRYVARKRADREALPTNVGGGQPPGGEIEQEPQNLKDAHKLMEAQGFFK